MSLWVSKNRRSLDGGWVGGVSCIQVYLGFLEFFNFAKPLRVKLQARKSYSSKEKINFQK